MCYRRFFSDAQRLVSYQSCKYRRLLTFLWSTIGKMPGYEVSLIIRAMEKVRLPWYDLHLQKFASFTMSMILITMQCHDDDDVSIKGKRLLGFIQRTVGSNDPVILSVVPVGADQLYIQIQIQKMMSPVKLSSICFRFRAVCVDVCTVIINCF